jgi:hypothetical protein
MTNQIYIWGYVYNFDTCMNYSKLVSHIHRSIWLVKKKSHLFYNSNRRSVNLQLRKRTRPCHLTLVRQDKFNALIKYDFFGAILPSLFSM